MKHTSETISIVICAHTRDRWRELGLSIRSALSQQPPVDEVVVVIDHNPELEAETRAAFPEAVVVPSRVQPGLSGARNTGVEVARGDILVFLDDDAYAAPEFVAQMVQHLDQPLTGGVTARVLPEWQGPRPRWFPDEFLWVVGCSHQGESAGQVRNLLGSGMCIRRGIFDRAGLFDCEIGRTRAGLPMGGEETELCIRASTRINGLVFYYEPAAIVRHHVKGERLTLSYFLKRCLAEGLSKGYLAALYSDATWMDMERKYVIDTLARARFADARAVFLGGDFAALQRIVVCTLGVACAAFGFCAVRAAWLMSWPRSRPAPKVEGYGP